MTLTLIRNAHVFNPDDQGQQDVLLGGGHILAIGHNFSLSGQDLPYTEHDAQGALLVPGLVDPLAHITGGGGEGGFHTRTPEMQLTDATAGGVTTLMAALGTDATTRTLPDLLAKASGLTAEGLTVYCYTGSYELPARTVLGNVRDDIILIDKIIGVGEVAIADHRSSVPSARDLAQVASDARVAGMLAGKAGVTLVHVGGSDERLNLIEEALALSDVPASQFFPTHINRSDALLAQAIWLSNAGMRFDLTASTTPELLAAGELSAGEALAKALYDGAKANMITVSSDGNASLPEFNAAGELIGLKVGEVKSVHETLQEAVGQHKVPLPQALRAVSTNAAELFKLPQKGRIAPGVDADLVLLEPATLAVQSVWARGQQLVQAGQPVVWGTFE